MGELYFIFFLSCVSPIRFSFFLVILLQRALSDSECLMIHEYSLRLSYIIEGADFVPESTVSGKRPDPVDWRCAAGLAG